MPLMTQSNNSKDSENTDISGEEMLDGIDHAYESQGSGDQPQVVHATPDDSMRYACMEDKWLAGLQQTPPKILSEMDLRILCSRVKRLLVEENNVQPIPAPVTICGDIHGQFYDLRRLFSVGGSVPETNYVFLGDYVDRGHNSVEVFQFLCVLKLKYPANITLLRGNHECRQITQCYGFYDEVIRKYGNAAAWRYCTDLFDFLTLAAIVNGRIFCVHGGLSPEIKMIDQLRLIHRVQEVPQSGAYGDMLWSDPERMSGWAINPRGAGYLFGADVVTEFNHLNDLDLIARAHQLAMDGYSFLFKDPILVTVWSAPNYCYRCGNVAAILSIGEDHKQKFTTFTDTDESKKCTVNRRLLPYFM